MVEHYDINAAIAFPHSSLSVMIINIIKHPSIHCPSSTNVEGPRTLDPQAGVHSRWDASHIMEEFTVNLGCNEMVDVRVSVDDPECPLVLSHAPQAPLILFKISQAH